jgi:hypothetical protein
MGSRLPVAILSLAALPTIAAATGGPPPIVLQGDTASMSLIMMDASLNSVSVNTMGDISVPRGNAFNDLGVSLNGGGNIQAIWDQNASGTQTIITAIFRTADGSQFMPMTAHVGQEPAVFWTWHFGVVDPVNFQPWVTSVTLNSAHVFFSADSGQTFSGSVDMTSNLPSNWMPGRDNGLTVSSIGDGTNFIMMQYNVGFTGTVPAPGGVATIALGSLLALRRRRR